MLFWCSVSSAVLRSSVVARLSMFLKRSMAEMFLWMLCLGRSSFDTNISVPLSSQRNSMGQQSWPWKRIEPFKTFICVCIRSEMRDCVCFILTAATTLFSETKMTLRSGRNSVFSCEGLNKNVQILKDPPRCNYIQKFKKKKKACSLLNTAAFPEKTRLSHWGTQKQAANN